jgi:hypothetical protein
MGAGVFVGMLVGMSAGNSVAVGIGVSVGGIGVADGGTGVLVGGTTVDVGSGMGVSGVAVVQPVKRASKRHIIKNRLPNTIVFIFPS